MEAAYARGESDEFVQPTFLDNPGGIVQNGDGLLLMNFRADRMRQLFYAWTQRSFSSFKRQVVPKVRVLSMVPYGELYGQSALFGAMDLGDGLAQVLADAGKTQLRIAETEKYAHVTYFLMVKERIPILARIGF